MHDASINKRISYGSIPQSSQGNEYNLNFWVYVNDYNYREGEDMCIIYKGETPSGTGLKNASVTSKTDNPNTKCNPSIWLLKSVNTLRVIIGLDTLYGAKDCKKDTEECSDEPPEVDYCDIKHFPLQRWVNVNVSLMYKLMYFLMVH